MRVPDAVRPYQHLVLLEFKNFCQSDAYEKIDNLV